MRDIVVCLFVCLCAASSSSIKKRFGAPPDVERACDPRDGNQTFVANVDDCNSYWECVHGWPYARQCPNELVWSHQEGRCEDKYTAVNEACGFLALPPPTTIVPPQYDGVCDVPCVSNPDEECVAFSMVCDGIAHCSDASDEPSECAPLCDPDTCRPPDCRCAGSDVPEGMSASQIPQMVMITSEGAIRLEDYNHLYTQVIYL
ncbi:PREDICTED: uncharacterized protein LOC106815126 [Priapulus caudatus]|uniref:Uncharacterized protein LOC106815126 n=1 Tax=Priapulus caudatus TaxID=37621 RepID=A0ABM1ES70_PRICU|nr:PREDICTED: uncharacterized protein LOC106815126 [Priapulus caudatus]